MPSIGSVTKTVRFYADDVEKIEKLIVGGMTFSGAVHHLIECSGTPKKGRSTPPKGTPKGTPYDIPEGILAGIKEMGDIAGLSLAEMLKQYLTLMEEGYLMYEDDGRIMPMKEEWEEELEALCQEKGLSLEEVGRRTMAALRKGVL